MTFQHSLPPGLVGTGPVGPPRGRQGFTLVELLIAATISLVVIAALATLFSIFSRTASNSQAMVQMTSRLRATANVLRRDLAGCTAPPRPPLNPDSAQGYFELIEGPQNDLFGFLPTPWPSGANAFRARTPNDSVEGDTDDALLFTTRSRDNPFTGRFGGAGQVESPFAEVAWFCRPMLEQPVRGLQLYNLYRRQLLVLGVAGAGDFLLPGTSPNNILASGSAPALLYTNFDISARTDQAGLSTSGATATTGTSIVPNTLADVMHRRNRFPLSARPDTMAAWTTGTSLVCFDGTSREGEDIILSNVISFDVRVFDPEARPRLIAGGGIAPILPHEQGYLLSTSPSSGVLISGSSTGFLASGTFTNAVGCFLDLGCLISSTASPASSVTWQTDLSGPGIGLLAKPSRTGTATYDTWTTLFERDGLDSDGDSLVDEGTDGNDNGGVPGVPDDFAEYEVPPPYTTPLQAIEILIRCYDPTSQEIRQFTVRHHFKP